MSKKRSVKTTVILLGWLNCFFISGLLLVVTPAIAVAKTFHIVVKDEGFSPSGLDEGETVTIHVGDTVVWTLKSANSHNIEDGDFEGHACAEVGLNHTFMRSGDKYSHTFTAPVDCYYRCSVHPPDMRGLIHVIENTGSSDPAKDKSPH